ncbi:MAG TPA: hypothetical protein VK707_03555 [Solirubrobacteraceae bacterium]|nr:hypothetical protein [Solirubrobacteraceae bacterium]
MRAFRRPRRYVHRRLLAVLAPLFVYNDRRDAYVLRGVGRKRGPVLKPDRRTHREPPADGVYLRKRDRVAHRLAT